MPSRKPLESRPEARRESIPESASDWLRQFNKHFEENFVNLCCDFAAEASRTEIRNVTVRAVIQTLLDSGEDTNSIAEAIGQAFLGQRVISRDWNTHLNQRRFELIDKEIQGSLTPAEQFELAGLTGMMREQLDAEANMPLEGAKALHRKLLELKKKGKPR